MTPQDQIRFDGQQKTFVPPDLERFEVALQETDKESRECIDFRAGELRFIGWVIDRVL